MTHTFYPTILILEDGTIYKGWSLINSLLSLGEIVFNTGMTGYQEIMTDPSYAGQIITFTYPELGNTGFNDEDNESNKVHVSGIIAKNICFVSSNWRQNISFVDYLLTNQIPHIFGVDTRSLTKHLRKRGVMNGCISNQIADVNILIPKLKQAPTMQGLDLVQRVTTKQSYSWKSINKSINTYSHLTYKTEKNFGRSLTVVLMDFGFKYNIALRLQQYGCNIEILPANSSYSKIMSYQPDGILLSNGPGDPSVVTYAVNTIKQIIDYTNIPIFGICMGHQILSLALGGETFKLKFGHRGLNHPSGQDQRSEVTSQNHGFAVGVESLSKQSIQVTHFNLNDLTIAGIVHRNKPVFSVQYHPEASPGPHDSNYLFKSFILLMKKMKLP